VPHQEQPEEDDQSYEAAAHNKPPIIPDRLTASFHVPVEHDLAEVGLFAPALAELAAPPAVRHQPEWPSATIAALASRPRSWSRLIRDLDDRYEAFARRSGAEAAS
jgi:hypothetical protein